MASKGSKTKNAAAARREKIEELRRAEKARDRRYRIITIVSCTVIVVGLVVGGYFMIDASKEKEAKAQAVTMSTVKTGTFKGMKTWKNLGRTHVEGSVKYAMSPPAGGNHNQVWQNCNGDVYEKPIANENAVHALEHGSVWVTYTDKAPAKDVTELEKRVKQTPYSLMSPYQDQDAPIILTAWGTQLHVDSATDPRVEKFFKDYVQGKQTPEPGAACTGGKSE
ncbi:MULTISPECIES: DUF3105 domain-containing protein [Streptomyces]|uniref:DUF3105 domain-containing protein n=1 Tax=Streptomyces lonegramiae TaxID=3075524 RepID=A0ABU2XRE8_9ACTN|nr:DUF3105 domain-containing protein [Streptomyces sp. DSM 41529]MDT0548039.1 DUF3105 domain-containing protein [Streptomyces sp. DSM 41529]